MTMLDKLNQFHKTLPGGYELKCLSQEEFQPLFDKYYPLVFKDKPSLNVMAALSPSEKEQMKVLNHNLGSPLTLRFGLFQGSQFLGWHIGYQKSLEEFYMRNSGVLTEHHGRGLYTSMLKEILCVLKEFGFQLISSKHNAANNAVIVPKLKAGFVITGFEISDKFGTMVRLEYYTNSLRKKFIDFRSGLVPVNDSDILKYME